MRGGAGVGEPGAGGAGAGAAEVKGDTGMDVLFLGSGVSTGVPKIGCIVRPDKHRPHCPVCLDALETPGSKNRRNNVSILIRVKAGECRLRPPCERSSAPSPSPEPPRQARPRAPPAA
mmetsp:Transcript_32715/g.82516  ORF Transcript_32715/g.82516 Transcript_32715/m.82516 type:complete len:118 (-) Transcript_32715:967-1320(-)